MRYGAPVFEKLNRKGGEAVTARGAERTQTGGKEKAVILRVPT